MISSAIWNKWERVNIAQALCERNSQSLKKMTSAYLFKIAQKKIMWSLINNRHEKYQESLSQLIRSNTRI